jgi:uncharacterized OsmC-like protein
MFKASIVSKGDKKYFATTQHSQFQLASDGSGVKPADALLASLCGCLGYHVGEFLELEKITFSEYSLSATSELTEDQTRLGDIHVMVEVKNAAIEKATYDKMLIFITQCYIYNTLKANSKIYLKAGQTGR